MPVTSAFADVGGLRLHYREAGSGAPVLLLHGWPTSSFLYRDILQTLADAGCRAIAPDLPGFGLSDKPVDESYSFHFHGRAISGLLDKLGVATTGLVVHDLGGPIGLHWAASHPERTSKLALLNTVVYPQQSWAVIAFVVACRLPLVRGLLASPWGLKQAMRLGVRHKERLTPDVIAEYQKPFATSDARKALLKSAYGLHFGGFRKIAAWMPTIQVPLQIVYGARDVILPDVAKTMARVARDVPHATVKVLPDCGHFLQEDAPAEVAAALAAHFGAR